MAVVVSCSTDRMEIASAAVHILYRVALLADLGPCHMVDQGPVHRRGKRFGGFGTRKCDEAKGGPPCLR
jgi:hypothetical protein